MEQTEKPLLDAAKEEAMLESRAKEPKVCCMGDGGAALRKVGKKGYCADHYAEACREASGIKNLPLRELLDEAEEPSYPGPATRLPKGVGR